MLDPAILRLGSRLLSIPANAIVDRRLLPVLLGLASAVPSAIDDHRCCWSLVLQPMVELIMTVALVLVVMGWSLSCTLKIGAGEKAIESWSREGWAR